MAMNVKGTVIQKCELQTGESKSGKSWQKREFVIETTEDQYPKQIAFTCFGDKVSMIESIAKGQNVDVHFNLESRPYNDKFFHNINAWKIDVASGQAKPTTESGLVDHSGVNAPVVPSSEPEGDELPF